MGVQRIVTVPARVPPGIIVASRGRLFSPTHKRTELHALK
jgi:hypothetical protein